MKPLLRFQKFDQIFKLGDKLLLTNEGLGTFLSSLPVEYSGDKDKDLDSELISWEMFRAIISPEIDPLDESRVNIISTLLEERTEEEEFREYVQRLLEIIEDRPIILGVGDMVLNDNLIERVEYIGKKVEWRRGN